MMVYLIVAFSIFALVQSVLVRKYSASIMSVGYGLAAVFYILSPKNLFYHSLAINAVVSLSLFLLIWLNRSKFSNRQLISSMLILVPFMLVWGFKGLHLQGADMLKYLLILPIFSLVYFTLERRTWDYMWVLLCIPSLWSASILLAG